MTDLLSFKEMCARFEVTPRTLRYYEYIELIAPKRVGRARFYGPREVARMTLILRGRRFGFSLEELRQWLLIYDQKGSQEQYRVWVELADRQLDVLQHQRDELAVTITDLRKLRDDVEQMLKEGRPEAMKTHDNDAPATDPAPVIRTPEGVEPLPILSLPTGDSLRDAS